MTIALGETTLCAGQGRSSDGSPVGPSGLRMELAPGVALRELVGADRVQGERAGCDHGTVSFGVTRVFATPEAALAWMRGAFLAEDAAGELRFGDAVVFARAAVTGRVAAAVGCAVAVSYTIEG